MIYSEISGDTTNIIVWFYSKFDRIWNSVSSLYFATVVSDGKRNRVLPCQVQMGIIRWPPILDLSLLWQLITAPWGGIPLETNERLYVLQTRRDNTVRSEKYVSAFYYFLFNLVPVDLVKFYHCPRSSEASLKMSVNILVGSITFQNITAACCQNYVHILFNLDIQYTVLLSA